MRIHPDHYEQEEQAQDTNERQECERCKQERDECKNELVLMKDRLQRVTADFDNFKKRLERDRASWTDTIEAELIKDLLPVIDDFDRAISEHKKKERSPEFDSWLTGFELIAKALSKFLTAHNVQEILNRATFDPQFHEAILQVAVEGKESGQIVDVVQKGYMYKDTVLRPAKVTVAQ